MTLFYLNWPVGEIVTRSGIFSREFHLILFGYEWHWWALDHLHLQTFSRHRSIRWCP